MLKKYSVLGALDMKLPQGWQTLVWATLFFFLFLGAVVSRDVVYSVLGAALVFAFLSAFLTSRVKSERKVKKALEVVSGAISIGILVFGYVVTGSFLLGIMTLVIVVLMFIAFTLSYLLPKMRQKVLANSRAENL